MSLALDTFVKRITDSGVLAPGKLERFVPPKAHPKDVQELARELVRSKQLTKFQVQQIYLGRAKALILGNYTILDKIGAGGMGQVFKAQHRRMERVVVIKTLPAATLKDPTAVARFQREVVAAAKLRHPNIVAADDADEAGGVHFLVMEYVEGRDLSAVVHELGPLPVATAAGYVLQAARGLEFAHKKGVIHRDIKPANLLLDHEGTVKVLDMGLARLRGDADVSTRAELTGTGAIMGTVDYMAPEQAESTKHADARADIYSLGCSLYYLLTARPTYARETLMARMLAHREAPIPALEGVPAPVRAVFERMVAKRPEDRFPTMTEVVAALEGCLAGAGAGRATAGPSGARRTGTDDDLTSFFRGLIETQAEPVTKPMPTAATMPMPSSGGGGRKKRLLLGAMAAGLLGLAVIAGIVVTLNTKEGTLVVEIDQPDAVVKVLDAEGKVELTEPGGKGRVEISVRPGKKELRVEKDGFVVYTSGKIEIGSGDSKPIRAHLEPLAIAKAPARSRETPEFQTWRNGLKALSAADRTRAVEDKLRELNPGYAEKGDWTITDGRVTGFTVHSDHLRDVSPLGALSDLTDVQLWESGPPPRQVPDLSGLAGLKLNQLVCRAEELTDIEPLRGMPLTNLALYQSRIFDLSPLKGMPLTSLAIGIATTPTSLEPLRGLALRTLGVEGAVADVSPVLGMPLKSLVFARTNITDLSPIAGMPLENLDFAGSPVADVSPVAAIKTLKGLNFTPATVTRGIAAVRAMPSLERIGTAWNANWPAKEFWERYDKGEFGKPLVSKDDTAVAAWVNEVAALPAARQAEAVKKKLMERNPGYGGEGDWKVEDRGVTAFAVTSQHLADLTPLRALPALTDLRIKGEGKAKVDLSGLAGLKLTVLHLYGAGVTDLSPLKGMPLEMLDCPSNGIADLSPLRGMPMWLFNCPGNPFHDLSPLRGMRLGHLSCEGCRVSDVSPLKGMPIGYLSLAGTNVSDLRPLEGMPLGTVRLHDTLVTDLSPLKGMKIKSLTFSPRTVTRGIEAIRSIDSFEQIGVDWGKEYPAREFWERYDKGEFGKPKAADATFDAWAKVVAVLPAEKQVEAVKARLKQRNPGYGGEGDWKIEPAGVTSFNVTTDRLADLDLAPLAESDRNVRIAAVLNEGDAPCRGSSGTRPSRSSASSARPRSSWPRVRRSPRSARTSRSPRTPITAGVASTAA